MRKKFISIITIAAMILCICEPIRVSAVAPLLDIWFGYIIGDFPEKSMKFTSYEEFEAFSDVYGDRTSLNIEYYSENFFKYESLELIALTTDDCSDSAFQMTGGDVLADPMQIEATKTRHGQNNDNATPVLIIEGGKSFITMEKEISVIEDVSRYLENADYIQGGFGERAEYNAPTTAKITSRSELSNTEIYDKYDDVFFENNFLLSVNWIEPSAQRTHNLTKLVYKNDFTNYVFTLELTQFFTENEAPDVLTSYCAVVPLPKKFLSGSFSSEFNEIIQIYNLEQFIGFADSVNDENTYEGKSVFLMNDIDLSSVCGEDVNGEMVSWEPIQSFGGSFDALGHTISGLYIHEETESREGYGLFGEVYGENAAIKNLTVDGSVYVSRPDLGSPSYADCGYAAAIAGYIMGDIENCRSTSKIETVGNALCAGGIVCDVSGSVSDCVFDGNVKSKGRYTGGICGYTGGYTSVKNCINSGSVTGDSCVGGIVGESANDIINCSNTGDVSGGEYVGGIAGQGDDLNENCTNTGNITGTQYIGGILGKSDYYSVIKNCSNEGAVKGDRCTGGILGKLCSDAVMEDCCNTGTVSGGVYAGGIISNDGLDTKIRRCCNAAAVTGTNYIGGIAGSGGNGLITDCYNTGAVSGVTYVGGISATFAPDGLKNCYNIGLVSGSEKVSGVGNISGKDCGEVDNCYYIDSCCAEGSVFEENYGTQKTSAEFASGEITYLLNGGTSDGELNWYQNIGEDVFPVLDKTHMTVLYDGERYYNQLHNSIKYENGKAVVTAEQDGTYALIFASYEADGKLLNTAAEEVQLVKGKNEPIEPQNFNAGGSVRVMLWNSIKEMKPLAIYEPPLSQK